MLQRQQRSHHLFAKEVNWNNGIFLQRPLASLSKAGLPALASDKIVKIYQDDRPEGSRRPQASEGSSSKSQGQLEHQRAKWCVTSRADWVAMNAALGCVAASVPKAEVMTVYDSVEATTECGGSACMKSLVNGPDAEKA